MVLKRKTVSKVTSALKARNAKDTVEENEAKVAARKLLKKPAAVGKDAEESEEESEASEVEESEVESSEEDVSEAKKTMKKPAAAAKMDVDSEEESDEKDESEDDEEEETKATGKTMKRPAAAAKKGKMDVDEDDDEDEEEDEEEEEAESEEETSKQTMKKPAAAKSAGDEESEDQSDEEEEEEDESEDEDAGAGQIVAVEEPKEATEKEIAAERMKELKSMGASDMKELMLSHGLQTGTKEVMIKSLLKHEAKVRAAASEQKAKIRAVVIQKKQELENLSTPELNKLCNDKGLKGLKGRPDRVQRLLVDWQENLGVDQALAKIVQDERKQELDAMDNIKLRKFCSKLGVDPFVKEVMVERISKQENLQGFYARPAVKLPREEEKEEKKVDMVDELLANEAKRAKERALQQKQEQVVASKRKELKTMSVEELKKRLAKKGLEAGSKRDDMIDALFIAGVQEDQLAARKTELAKMATQDLKDLLSLNGLDAGGKDQMVKTMLAHEAKCREELKVFDEKVDKVAAEKQEQLEKKSNAHLKDLCNSKGLPAKGEKEERVERIIEEEKQGGEFDNVVSLNNRKKREAELMAMDKSAVLKLCENAGVDPYVKGIMVERIMSQESEAGEAIVADDEPASKKARARK